jgi:hypothetical protein
MGTRWHMGAFRYPCSSELRRYIACSRGDALQVLESADARWGYTITQRANHRRSVSSTMLACGQHVFNL